jgi:cytochrome c-type biogenesis protein
VLLLISCTVLTLFAITWSRVWLLTSIELPDDYGRMPVVDIGIASNWTEADNNPMEDHSILLQLSDGSVFAGIFDGHGGPDVSRQASRLFTLEALDLTNPATAFAAGFVSFLSPCVWPLVPAYLSYVSGVPYDELGSNRRRVVLTTLAFVGGFSIVFALYGVSVGYLGALVADYRRPIEIVGGVLVILMGLALLGFAQRLVGREARVGLPARPTTYVGAGFAGVVFAVGWTPCIGPILTSILLYAATQGSAGGSLLLLAYGIGLGVPFLLSGLLASWLLERTGAYRKYGAWINRVAGVVMIIVGVLLATGQMTRITQQLSELPRPAPPW